MMKKPFLRFFVYGTKFYNEKINLHAGDQQKMVQMQKKTLKSLFLYVVFTSLDNILGDKYYGCRWEGPEKP
jgi:hypothetical protein